MVRGKKSTCICGFVVFLLLLPCTNRRSMYLLTGDAMELIVAGLGESIESRDGVDPTLGKQV